MDGWMGARTHAAFLLLLLLFFGPKRPMYLYKISLSVEVQDVLCVYVCGYDSNKRACIPVNVTLDISSLSTLSQITKRL